MRVLQREGDVREHPRRSDGQQGQRNVGAALCAFHLFDNGKLRDDRKKTSHGANDHQEQNERATVILQTRASLHSSLARICHHDGDQCDVEAGANFPSYDEAGYGVGRHRVGQEGTNQRPEKSRKC